MRSASNIRQFLVVALASSVVLAAGCILDYEEFRPAPTGSGGAGNTTEMPSSTGVGGEGDVGGGGGGGASTGGNGTGGSEVTPKCVVPDNLLEGPMPYEVLESDAGEHIHCYVLFTDLANWNDANKKCIEVMPWSRLAVIHNKLEHDKVLNWLRNLSGQFTGPWVGGSRDPNVLGPFLAGAFKWSDSSPWQIFPCDPLNVSPCDNMRGDFWGTVKITVSNLEADQPNGHGDCVQYGIWPEEITADNGEPLQVTWKKQGLADTECTDKRGYLCEWQMAPPP